jgi:hypothetical protein
MAMARAASAAPGVVQAKIVQAAQKTARTTAGTEQALSMKCISADGARHDSIAKDVTQRYQAAKALGRHQLNARFLR